MPSSSGRYSSHANSAPLFLIPSIFTPSKRGCSKEADPAEVCYAPIRLSLVRVCDPHVARIKHTPPPSSFFVCCCRRPYVGGNSGRHIGQPQDRSSASNRLKRDHLEF